ncbi:uncharacterized protein LOC114385874 [Glycine soja]|nr:uncharacterized protein LOC114385874 [Glycine soja]
MVWDCQGSKSPGPDGFNFKIIKSFCSVVKDYIWCALHEFHEKEKIPQGANASFIALILKLEDPQGLGDFRLISLIGCMYKIMAKVLAKRLKGVVHKVIDEGQSTFVGGRNILNGVVIVNELVDEAKRKKKLMAIFKLDFEKTYDSMRWKFLYYIMRRMGFCERWIKWIKSCVKSTSMSVLVDGCLTEEFYNEK